MLHEEEVFDGISIHHEQYVHCKARGMHNVLKKTYHNISEDCLKLFVETCPVCNEETKNKKSMQVQDLQSAQHIFVIDSK